MRATVKKWGNSAAVRIPTSVMEATKLYLDAEVDVREENGNIVIEPVRDNSYSLQDLVAAITDANLHAEFDFGKPAGKEAL